MIEARRAAVALWFRGKGWRAFPFQRETWRARVRGDEARRSGLIEYRVSFQGLVVKI